MKENDIDLKTAEANAMAWELLKRYSIGTFRSEDEFKQSRHYSIVALNLCLFVLDKENSIEEKKEYINSIKQELGKITVNEQK